MWQESPWTINKIKFTVLRESQLVISPLVCHTLGWSVWAGDKDGKDICDLCPPGR